MLYIPIPSSVFFVRLLYVVQFSHSILSTFIQIDFDFCFFFLCLLSLFQHSEVEIIPVIPSTLPALVTYNKKERIGTKGKLIVKAAVTTKF